MEEEHEKYSRKALISSSVERIRLTVQKVNESCFSSMERIRLTNEKIRESFLVIDFLYGIEFDPVYPELKPRENENGGEKNETQSDEIPQLWRDH